MTLPTDQDVFDLAHRLAELSSGASSNVYRMSWWNERLLNWALARPEFKAQLFRFVDVFPATSGRGDVLRHVREYLGTDVTPALLRRVIGLASGMPFGATVTAAQARRNISRMADQFILGTNAGEAVKGAEQLWKHGSATTIDLLGEKTVNEYEAHAYAARVLELLDALVSATAKWKPVDSLDGDDLGVLSRASISVKPTALACRYGPLTRIDGLSQAKDRLRPILRRAVEGGALVWIDMEHHEVKDLTLELFCGLLDEVEFSDLEAGVVIQAYLTESYQDLAELIAWSAKRSKPVFVRLVKGAYWDTETIHAKAHGWPVPVFERKVESDANYERCTRLLLDHHGEIRAAFASHNLRSLAYAIAYARKNDLPDNSFEIQMLYGMAEPMHEAIRREGLRLRVYAPVGELVPGMAYLVRRLLENTSNDSFVRMHFADGKALDDLLVAPVVDRIPGVERGAPRNLTDVKAMQPYVPEPLAQWHQKETRDVMSGALHRLATARVVGESQKENRPYVHAIIDGERVITPDDIDSVDPAAPDVIVARSAACTAPHAHDAIAAAERAWPSWSATPVEQRCAVLFRAADWLRRCRFELAALEVREAGKPWADADGDVCEAIDFLEYYGREMLRLDAGGRVQSPPGEINTFRYQSRGVGVVIAPWNFPLAIPAGMVSAALVAGNAVCFKPAEQTPAIASKLVEAFAAAGLPRGVLNFLPGSGEHVGAALVEHPGTSFIAFTGSKPVGLSIVAKAAIHQPGQRHIKRVIAELGGKNPMIIDTDADLDQAVPAIIASAFDFSGQKCSALSRLIVLEPVKDELIKRLIGAMGVLRIGSPSDMHTDIGPVIDDEAQKRIQQIIEGAFMWGDVAISRSELPDRGYFVAPTIVNDVKTDSPLARDEIFGPVLAVFAVDDIDQALTVANDTDYALTAGIFSRSPSVIARVARDIRAGNIYINRSITGAIVGRQPFGGYGMSGVGSKAGGPDYLLQFLEPRVTTENIIRQGFGELN